MNAEEQIALYTQGKLDDKATVALFQELIDSGLVWELRGSYARKAVALIERGDCHWQRKVRTYVKKGAAHKEENQESNTSRIALRFTRFDRT